MNLRTRLYLVAFGMILVLLAPAYYALDQLGELRDIAFDLRSRHAAAFLTVGHIQTTVAELNRLQRSYVAAPGSEVEREVRDRLERAGEHVARLQASDYAEEAQAVAWQVDALAAASQQLDRLLLSGRVEEATDLFQSIKPMFSELHQSLEELAATIDERSTSEAARAQQISATAARTSALAVVVALVAALLLGLVSIGALTSPLKRLRAAMAAVAGGRFSPPTDLPYRRTDEIGDLSRSFRSMAQQLAELDRLKAEFVSIASHELKTPVSVIRGYAEMCADGFYGEVNEKQHEVLSYIQEQTEVLVERVNQLLALSRFQAKGLGVELGLVELPRLLEELRRTFAGIAAQEEVAFRVEADPSAPRTFRADAARVQGELLGNLVANAFKFTPPGGEVSVRAWGREGRIIFEVRDTGEGIPKAQLPYIFEKYYQAGRHAGKVGAGLGLAIAREIVEAHGGTIRAESEPGWGTTFHVELPTDARPLRRAERRSDGEGARVLTGLPSSEADSERGQVPATPS